MIELYRLDYVRYNIQKIENLKNFILVSLKNSIGMLGDIFLVKKTSNTQEFIQGCKAEYRKYDMSIADLDMDTIKPIVKMRVSSALFMVIFSAEIIDLLIGNKVNINNILDNY